MSPHSRARSVDELQTAPSPRNSDTRRTRPKVERELALAGEFLLAAVLKAIKLLRSI
jgi:hypothetical protein